MASPLRPVDWEQVKAKEWLALFPGVVGAPTREERLLSAQARAWFAVIQKPHKHKKDLPAVWFGDPQLE